MPEIKMSSRSGVAGHGSSFPVANNVLQRKWNQRTYQMHVAKKKGMKNAVDATSPKVYPHLQVNMKKLQMEEEKQAVIDHENRLLLAKLTNIIRSGGMLDNWNFEHEQFAKSMNAPQRNKEQERIERENAALLKRLNNVKPAVRFDKMEDDYLMHNYFLAQKAQATRNFEVDTRGVDDKEKFVFYAKDRHANKEKTFISGDIEETIEEPAEGEATELQSNKLPDVVTKNQKVPPREKLKRRATKLPLLGAERKKAEEKKKKEAAVKPISYNQKDEAAKLFKATKGMGNPEQILVQTLAKRTYQQRQDTLQKFEENYGLTLEQELKSNLSAEYDDIIDALLATREDLDALTVRRALKGEDSLVEPFIEIMCTRSNTAIAAIKEAYQTKYGVSLEGDITAEIKGKLKHLFLALAKGSRSEDEDVDDDAVQLDAEALRDAGTDERWDASGGKMAELLQERSLLHFREVLMEYDKMTFSNLEKELGRTLLGDFKDAMLCLVRCVSNSTQYLSERLHASLSGEADDMTLFRVIITRSELDLPQIRRSYKRLYKQTLVEALEQRCQAAYKSALVQMVVVHGAPQRVEQPKEAQPEDDPLAARTLGTPRTSQQMPLRRPSPNPSAKIPSHNPLFKSALQPKDSKRPPGTPQKPAQGGARSKQANNVPGSPVKARQAPTGLKNREGTSATSKKTSTPPRKTTPPKISTPPRKTTPPKTSKTPKQSAKPQQVTPVKTKGKDEKDLPKEEKSVAKETDVEKEKENVGNDPKESVQKDENKPPVVEDKKNDEGVKVEEDKEQEGEGDAEMKSVTGSEKTESEGDQTSETMSTENGAKDGGEKDKEEKMEEEEKEKKGEEKEKKEEEKEKKEEEKDKEEKTIEVETKAKEDEKEEPAPVSHDTSEP